MSAAGAASHVERGLEVHERLREIAVGLREAGEVQARRRERPRVACLLGGGERGLVGLACLLGAAAALVRDGE